MNIDHELRRLFSNDWLDDRLDVAVRPDADRVIIAGARRIRRRRFAAATMSAVAVAVLLGSGIALAGGGMRESLPPAEPASTVVPTTTEPPATTTTTPKPVAKKPPAPPRTETRRETTETEVAPTKESTSTPPRYSLDVIGPASFGPLELGMAGEDALATGLLGAVEMLQEGVCTRYTATFGGHVIVSANYGVVRVAVTAPVSTPEGIHLGSTVGEVRATYPGATDYRMGLTASTGAGFYGFAVAGPGDHTQPWPDTGIIDRIEIDGPQTDCVGAM